MDNAGPEDFDIPGTHISRRAQGQAWSEIEIYLHSSPVDVWHEFVHAAQLAGIDPSTCGRIEAQ
jgi:hypothetical protein